MNQEILEPIYSCLLNGTLTQSIYNHAEMQREFALEGDLIKIDLNENANQEELNYNEKPHISTLQVFKQNNKYSIYPGQSKNYYKNMGQKITQFILTEFQDVNLINQDVIIKRFLKTNSQKHNRNSIKCLLKSQMARKLCRLFFFKFKWVKYFLKENKSDLDLYFRYNKIFNWKKKSRLNKIKVGNVEMGEEN